MTAPWALRAGAGLLLLLFGGGLLGGDAAAPACSDAASQIGGLRLHVTLPYSEYGPGAPIRVMATFRNQGGETLVLALPPKAEASVRAEGKVLAYAPRADEGPPAREEMLREVTLAPGECVLWAFTIQPGRRDLLPGDYPLAVCAVLAPAPAGGGAPGAKRVAGALRSNEVPLKIRYNVLWVG